MAVLLRNKPTGLYFKEPGRWTGDAGDALPFASGRQALEFIRHFRLQEVELASDFEAGLSASPPPRLHIADPNTPR